MEEINKNKINLIQFLYVNKERFYKENNKYNSFLSLLQGSFTFFSVHFNVQLNVQHVRGRPSYRETINENFKLSTRSFAKRFAYLNYFEFVNCETINQRRKQHKQKQNKNVMYKSFIVSFALISAASAIFLSGNGFCLLLKSVHCYFKVKTSSKAVKCERK